MEELQSTAALDKEIREDARKKAFKILKSTGESISASKANWQQKLRMALNNISESYAQKTLDYQREVMARLPMDKQRIRLETIDRFLNTAMVEFLESLDRPSMLRILEKSLLLGAGEFSLSKEKLLSGQGDCSYRCLSREECTSLLGACFPGITFRYKEDPLLGAAVSAGGVLPADNAFPAIEIDFPQARFTVSAVGAAETLLLDYRAELATALMGNLEDVTISKDIRLFSNMSGPAERESNA